MKQSRSPSNAGGTETEERDAANPLPSALPPRARLGIGAVIVLVLLAFAVTIGIGMLRGATGAEIVDETASPSTSSAALPAEAGLYVHVAGAVREPGLYRLDAGDRVADAIARAGGFADDAQRDGVNLARPVADGEQIVVPVVGAEAASTRLGRRRQHGWRARPEHRDARAARRAPAHRAGDGRPHPRVARSERSFHERGRSAFGAGDRGEDARGHPRPGARVRGRPGARRRSLRAVSVAAATWATAGASTMIRIPPRSRWSSPSLRARPPRSRGGGRRCSRSSRSRSPARPRRRGTVATAGSTRAQIAALEADGGRHLELEVTVTGRIDGSPDGGAWFDAVATRVRAGALAVTGRVPARILVDAEGRSALEAASMGSEVRLRGRAVPSDPGERAASSSGRVPSSRLRPRRACGRSSRDCATASSPRPAACPSRERVWCRGSPWVTRRASTPTQRPR